MTHPELFEVAETLSPLEAWKRRHKVHVEWSSACQDYHAWGCTGDDDECPNGDSGGCADSACAGEISAAEACQHQELGIGETPEAAMLDWARNNGVPGWLEEAYLEKTEAAV